MATTVTQERPATATISPNHLNQAELTSVMTTQTKPARPETDNKMTADAGPQNVYFALPIRDRRAQEHLKEAARNLTKQKDIDQYHLSLHYLSDVSQRNIEQLRYIGRVVCNWQPAFGLRLSQPGLFDIDGNDQEMIAYYGVEESSDLRRLQKKLGQTIISMAGLSLAKYHQPERYNPHITLGRTSPDNPPQTIDDNETVWPVRVVELRIAESSRGPNHLVDEFRLSGDK